MCVNNRINHIRYLKCNIPMNYNVCWSVKHIFLTRYVGKLHFPRSYRSTNWINNLFLKNCGGRKAHKRIYGGR